MNQYPENVIILPLDSKVLLPSVLLRLMIRGNQAKDLTKVYFRQASKTTSTNKPMPDIYVACIPVTPMFTKTIANNTDGDQVVSQAPQLPLPSHQDNKTKSDDSILLSDDHRNRLLKYGCLARIVRVQRSGTNLFGIFVEGLIRFEVNSIYQNATSMTPYPGSWMSNVTYYNDDSRILRELSLEENHLVVVFKELSQIFVVKMKELQLPDSLIQQLSKVVNTKPISSLADLLVSLIETTFEERLQMLAAPLLKDRLKMASEWLTRQLHVLQISDKLGTGIDGALGKRQREFYLRQQLEAIQNELNEKGEIKGVSSGGVSSVPEEDEFAELHRVLVGLNLPNNVLVIAQRELKKVKKLPPSSAEYSVSQNYLEWLASMPWDKKSEQSIDILKSKIQLDQDHFGLQHVKKRIIEYLSVIKIKGDLKAPILCFVGPPGVGKTSLGKSIAQAMSRSFHRISLGGVRDEAEIRGHRRTYVGSMPGLIVQGLRKCKVNNPLFLLDEIDKLSQSSRNGDPAAALLEVLDPEQNNSFSDHYLNVPVDLSGILFIATANSLDTIPEALLDRMEVIELHGYTFEEKLHISKTHLVPKQILAHGLQLEQIRFADEAILYVAENYTRESGVRTLERALASVIRAKCVEFAELREKDQQYSYNPFIYVNDIISILGRVKYQKEISEREPYPGVVTGLAYSGSGNGGILFVEASKMPGEGKLHLTGSLGKVIQESAQLALSWVKTHAFELKLTTFAKEKLVEQDDIHIHFPAGSISKDGPSAGVTLVCAIVSLYSGYYVPTTTAMTGEISLRGQVLPVGGIKEKVVSAHRAGIRKIILPFRNQVDVEQDVPEKIKSDIHFVFAKHIWDVLVSALVIKGSEEWNTRVYESNL
ncbi:ATP-dependent protease La [Thamnidium elegans]|nr:ATP-dependent protease La [Thamnidium elegans]